MYMWPVSFIFKTDFFKKMNLSFNKKTDSTGFHFTSMWPQLRWLFVHHRGSNRVKHFIIVAVTNQHM